ncbi:MAG TPA: HD domain-containing protein [Candidatus Aenigmarchaeota archaeon]|nr:HD domain-containing protein [Candidatus Aenigmarchaeota archaeon]
MDKDKESIIEQTAEFVKRRLEKEATGHDWWHAYRVWKLSLRIAEEEENVDLFVIQLAALLHDIADWKFCKGDDAGAGLAKKWLEKLGLSEDVISHVCEIIKNISFKGARVKTQMKTKEGMIVQDADRLDALGAIGIARCFATGAKLNREIYNPKIKPKLHKTFEEYKKAESTSINHFYEKLLLLKDLMNTKAAKRIAEERHNFMEQFLERFFREWEGKG